MSSCTLPWTGSRQQHQEFNKNTSMVEHPTIVEDVDQEDSAFLEPEYSNPPSSFESFNQGRHLARPYNIDDDEEDDGGNYSSPCPDYEEVDPLQIQRLRLALQNTDLSDQGQNKAVSVAVPSPALTTATQQQQLPPPPLPRLPMTNGLLGQTSPEPGVQLRRSPNGIKIGLGGSPSVMRNVRNRWSANLESVKGFMTGGGVSSDFRSTEEAHKQETIMKSVVNCIHKEQGCRWFGPLNKLKAHLNVCQKDAVECLNACGAKIGRQMMEDHMLTTCSKRLVPCPYCKQDFAGAAVDDHAATCGFEPVHCENKCGLKIQRNRLRAHMVNTCSKRLIDCAYCVRCFTADTLQAHHATCRRFPVICPNRCGTSADEANTYPREEIEIHLKSHCPNRPEMLNPEKKCTFAAAGCPWAGSASDYEGHLKTNLQLHLDLMCSLVHKQESHIKKLNGQLERSNTCHNGVLVWKVRGVSEKIAEAKKTGQALELVSVPFYTSQCGYKMQVSLFVNGNGAGEDSHMSVYIKVLPGEYDSILKWPFKHTVSFTLLDQTPERKTAVNIVESFLPDPNWPNFARPSTVEEPDSLGFGFPKFVSHEMVASRNYVKDDCLFLKIRVDPSRNVAV